MSKVNNGKIFILSEPVHSGTSSALKQWIIGKDVTGFLTPMLHEIKVLFNIETSVISVYEIASNNKFTQTNTNEAIRFPRVLKNQNLSSYKRNSSDKNIIKVGNYFLSKRAFIEANYIITNALKQNNKQWLLIDEVGKLELENKGHHLIVLKVFERWKNNILLVVRDSLLDDVIKKYDIKEFSVINQQKLKDLI